MQKIIEFMNTRSYDVFIPLTALALLRLAMCRAQLRRTASIREKKGVYHAVRDHYAEIGAWLGILPFCLLGLILSQGGSWLLRLYLAEPMPAGSGLLVCRQVGLSVLTAPVFWGLTRLIGKQ